MISREQVESLLKINGVQPTSPDEQIRSVLMSARYSKDEVDTAIMILRENKTTKETRVDGLHKVFRSQEALNSSEIATLLGIDVELNTQLDVQTKSRAFSVFQYTLVWFLSLLFALGGILAYMYLHKIGVFHPSSGITLAIL